MSRTEIYAVVEDGNIEFEAEISNSYRGAMHVWTALAVKYGLVKPGEEGYLLIRPGLMDQVWKLRDDERLSWWERVVLLSTFDKVVILRDDLPRAIEAFRAWAGANVIINTNGAQEASSIGAQGLTFKRMLERGFRGACFNQTSVCANPWWVYDNSGDEEEGRPFNIDRDTEWWSLFDEYPSLRGVPVVASSDR